MKRHNVYLAEQQLEGLAKLAERTGIKTAEHIRRALDAYLAARLEQDETLPERQPVTKKQ